MRKQYVILAIFFAFAIFLFLLRGLPQVKGLASFVQSLFSGPKSSIYTFKAGLFGAGSESGEVPRLKKENAELVSKLIDYKRTVRDNEALRSQFEEALTKNYKMMPARIIGFLGKLNDPEELVINVGEANGVKRGMAVVSGTDLVGKVAQVSDSYSKVFLLSNENFSEVAKTVENGSLGVIQGQRDFILLTRVSIKDKISNNETVLTRGAGDTVESLIPQGLVIGKITSIYKNESMPYQTAKLISNIPLAKLETVFVVLGF